MMPTSTLDNLLGSRFFNQYVGFDPFFKSIDSVIDNTTNLSFPPHDIVNHQEGVYAITLALAGFEKKDLDVILQGQTLTISGNMDSDDPDKENLKKRFLHRGIAKRCFRKVFALGRHTEIENVIFKNGLLTVHLKEVVPESKKPRQIEIMTM
tara:strand:- start:67 stop:522 length:456 start_codon:yes stop_codon:yes gene_type:complete